jgi:tetratricopeptide (TPR) repeat protein
LYLRSLRGKEPFREMADINSLINSKLTTISQENITQANEKCREADQCILKVRDNTDKEKELVKEALGLYQESIKIYSKQAQPYVGIAFIAYSSGDLKMAQGLLIQALEIEPLHEYANELYVLIKSEYKQKNISQAVSRVAGKSLSEKLQATEKKSERGLFDKITSIFVKSVSKKSSETVNQKPPQGFHSHLTDAAQKTVPAKTGPVSSGNFYENMKKISTGKD